MSVHLAAYHEEFDCSVGTGQEKPAFDKPHTLSFVILLYATGLANHDRLLRLGLDLGPVGNDTSTAIFGLLLGGGNDRESGSGATCTCLSVLSRRFQILGLDRMALAESQSSL